MSAVLKDSATYEHITPETVGNRQRVLLSDLSGRGNVLYKLKQHGLAERLDAEARRQLLERVKHLDIRAMNWKPPRVRSSCWFARRCIPAGFHSKWISYEVTTRMIGGTTATVTLHIQDSVHTATANGHGPVNALDLCLRKCLSTVYPKIQNVRLTDYKVRVLDSKKGTAAKVRVLVEWSDHRRSWATVGVSDNVIEASWLALVDAIRLELMRLTEQDENIDK